MFTLGLLWPGVRRGGVGGVDGASVGGGADPDGQPTPVLPLPPPACGGGPAVRVLHLPQSPRPQRHAEWRHLPAVALESRGIIQDAVCHISADCAEGADRVHSQFTWVGFNSGKHLRVYSYVLAWLFRNSLAECSLSLCVLALLFSRT